MHDVEWVHAVGPFFCTDGEADTSPGGFAGVAAAGDGAGVEGVHDVLVYLSVLWLLVWFYCSTVLSACVNPVLPACR